MSDPIHESNDCIGPKNVVYILYVLHTTNMERNILATEPCKILTLLFFVTPVTFNKSRTCKTDTPVYPFPVLTNPHELSWPPSTLDGWECCLLSMLPFKQNHCGLFFIQIAICYLRYYTRQFFPTTVVVWAALVAFALQQLNNNSLDQT